MAVTHYLQTDDLVNKLKEIGVLIEGDLIQKNGRVSHFANVLNYEDCDPEAWDRHRQELYYYAEVGHWKESMVNWENCIEQAKYFPLHVVDENTVSWESEEDANEDPLNYISKALLEDIVGYEAYANGNFLNGGFFKNRECVTKEGEKVFSVVPHVKSTLIGDAKNGFKRVTLPFVDEQNISKFVYIYVEEKNLNPHGKYISLPKDNTEDVSSDSKDQTDSKNVYMRVDITSPIIDVYEDNKEEASAPHKDKKPLQYSISSFNFATRVNLARTVYACEKRNVRNVLGVNPNMDNSSSGFDNSNGIEDNEIEDSLSTISHEEANVDIDDDLPFC